jgi:peptide/nickel transport system substrate-binding protein
VALWVACGETRVGSIVRVGTDVDAETLDPRLMRNTTAYRVVNLIYDGLVQLDSNLQPVPGLPDHWEHPNPTTWVFHLRPGVAFQDRSPLTAVDVVHTFQSMLDPRRRAPLRALYTPIRQVEAVGDSAVRFTLSAPYAPLLKYLDLGILPRQVEISGGDLAARPVGTGPYRLVSWDKGATILLRANPDYWGGKPMVDQVRLVLVPDNTARAQAFEAGDLDLIQSPLAPQDVKRLLAGGRFPHVIGPGLAFTYLSVNLAHAPLDDVRVRRAIALLVDQQAILGRIYEDTEMAATSVLLPGWFARSRDAAQPGYDSSSAKQLLADAGWRDTDGDGVLDKGGKRLAIRLGTHSEDANRIQTVEFLQEALTRAGIKVSVEVSDWPSFSAKRDAGDFDLILLGWTQLVDPDRALFEQLHSTGGLNWGRYRNPMLDRALDRGRFVESPDQRAAAYGEAARIISQDLPYYVLSYQSYQVFYSPRIGGFVPEVRGMLRGLSRATLR